MTGATGVPPASGRVGRGPEPRAGAADAREWGGGETVQMDRSTRDDDGGAVSFSPGGPVGSVLVEALGAPSDPEEHFPTDRLLTPEEVARYLRVSRSYVYTMARDGTIPSIRVGSPTTGPVRFRLSSIARWVAEREYQPRPIRRIGVR